MSEIKLGRTDNFDVFMDIDDLFMRRLLVQGISGSGKSTLLENILYGIDQNMNGVQKVIIDWEGEFSSKLKSMNFTVIGTKSLPATLEKAQEYGKTIRLNNQSVIIDISKFKKMDDRQIFVGRFIDAFLDEIEISKFTNKDFKKCVFVIDEAHNLCQQSGSSESRDSIIRLCETGRKRNIATILATQRLSEINKNASAQMANSIIGLTTDLTDRERSLKFLGLSRGAEELAEIRHLKAGEFYVSGTSIRVKKFGTMTISEKSIRIKSEFKSKPKAKKQYTEEEIVNDVIENTDDLIKKFKDENYNLRAKINKMESLLKANYTKGFNEGWDVGYKEAKKFDQDGFKRRTTIQKLREIFE